MGKLSAGHHALSAAVIADTHALIWYLEAPQNLSPVALAALDGATAMGDPIHVSAISLVELTYLVEKGRLAATQSRLDAAVRAANTAFAIVSLDLPLALALRQVPRAVVPDMPDRIIAATALHLGLPLVTRDLQIRAAAPITTIW